MSSSTNGSSPRPVVEVDVVEEGVVPPWMPRTSLDMDELAMVQADYAWKMEQVRFETERMAREREMRRQRQELEYQAALFDRQRLELERKTEIERLKFEHLQRQEQVALDVQAAATPALARQYFPPLLDDYHQ